MLTWPAATRLRPWKRIQEKPGPRILKCSQKGLRTNWISRLKTRCSYSEQAVLSATGHSETASLGKEGSYPWTCARRKVPERPSVAISKNQASCALSFCPPQPHPKSKEEMHRTKGQHAQRLPQQHILWSPHHSGAQWRASFVLLYWGTALGTLHGRPLADPALKSPVIPHLCHSTVAKFPPTAKCSPKDAYPSSLGG